MFKNELFQNSGTKNELDIKFRDENNSLTINKYRISRTPDSQANLFYSKKKKKASLLSNQQNRACKIYTLHQSC
jgi:hypothetical protein